jgi:hypothetical protein
LFSLIAVGMLSLATMLHFPVEMAAPNDPSITIGSSSPTQLQEREATPQENSMLAQAFPASPRLAIITPAPSFPVALWLLLAGTPVLAFLLIAVSRWRLPVSTPVSDDPARHLRSSLR